jgi:hypothetical protein
MMVALNIVWVVGVILALGAVASVFAEWLQPPPPPVRLRKRKKR